MIWGRRGKREWRRRIMDNNDVFGGGG